MKTITVLVTLMAGLVSSISQAYNQLVCLASWYFREASKIFWIVPKLLHAGKNASIIVACIVAIIGLTYDCIKYLKQ